MEGKNNSIEKDRQINDQSINIMNHEEKLEEENWEYREIPSSWKEAAKSWRMSFKEYAEIAYRMLDEHYDDPFYTLDKMVPLFNPYATLDTRSVELLGLHHKTPEEYHNAIEQLEKDFPKFTVPR